MSSALQTALTTLLQYNYVSVAILTAVVYDYVLTFSDEVEFIWSKPWSWVSTLFILVRYFGLCNFIISALGEILDIINEWVFVFFFGAADLVAILRVWAMYNRSRPILGILLALFGLEVISILVAIGIDSDPKKLQATTVQILDFSFCTLQATAPVWTNITIIIQTVNGAALCMLGLFQVSNQSLRMYRATKAWQPNRYMGLLVQQGVLSFFAIFLFNLINVLSIAGTSPTGGQTILLVILEYVPIYTLTPRFILSIRELYTRDIRGRGEGIDTGFGLSLAEATIEFAAARQNESLEDVEEMPMELRIIRDV